MVFRFSYKYNNMPLICYTKKNYIKYKTPESQKKKTSTKRYNNRSLLKGFKIFLIDGSFELPLETGHLNDL